MSEEVCAVTTPKLSLGAWAFLFGPFKSDSWSLERVFEFAVDAGYDGVELTGFRPHAHPDDFDTDEKCSKLVSMLEDYELGVSGYGPDLTSVPPADVETEEYLEALRKGLTFCDRCGITTLRVDTVSPPTQMSADDYEKRLNRLVTTWRAAAREAARAGVLMVWEFEPGFWLNKPSEVKRLLEAVGDENFKVLFDTSHAYMGAVVGARQTGERETLAGGVVEYAKMLADWIGHFHLIDSDGTLHDNETSTHAAFGSGFIDFREVLIAMKPFVGDLPWWCVDFCFNADAPVAAKGSVAFLDALMKDILA